MQWVSASDYQFEIVRLTHIGWSIERIADYLSMTIDQVERILLRIEAKEPVSALIKRLIAKLQKLPPGDHRRLVCTASA